MEEASIAHYYNKWPLYFSCEETNFLLDILNSKMQHSLQRVSTGKIVDSVHDLILAEQQILEKGIAPDTKNIQEICWVYS